MSLLCWWFIIFWWRKIHQNSLKHLQNYKLVCWDDRTVYHQFSSYFLQGSKIIFIHYRAIFKGMSLPGSLFAFYITSKIYFYITSGTISTATMENFAFISWGNSTVIVVSDFVPELWQKISSRICSQDWRPICWDLMVEFMPGWWRKVIG